MKTFKQYISESGRLFRFDDKPIIPKAQRYGFAPSNRGSANVSFNPPSHWEQKTGLFAGKYHNVLTYAVPRDTRWIVTGRKTKNKNPTVYFDEKDRNRIVANRPVLSQYNIRQGFKPLLTGEYFAQGEISPKPISQKVIEDPLEHIKKHYNIMFIRDLDTHKRNLEDEDIPHAAEGDFRNPLYWRLYENL